MEGCGLALRWHLCVYKLQENTKDGVRIGELLCLWCLFVSLEEKKTLNQILTYLCAGFEYDLKKMAFQFGL